MKAFLGVFTYFLKIHVETKKIDTNKKRQTEADENKGPCK